MPNITENPDYRLVMTFLQNIRPGDMDQESSDQLMMIGQRIEAGGALTDREREMFESVVSNMPAMPEAMTPRETTGAAMMPPPPPMPSQDGMTYGPSSGVTVDPNVMDMQQMMDAGIVSPTRPQGRPAPMRPQARPMRQEVIMAEVNVENMEDNAKMFEHKMGFSHDADGLDMSDEQLVNFLLMCQQEYVMGDEEEYHEDDEEMMEMPDGKDVKVKVMRLGGGNVHELMNELLGG